MKKMGSSRIALVSAVTVSFCMPLPAWADGGHDPGEGPVAFLAGLATGMLASPYIAAAPPAPVYVQPSVVYAPPPPPPAYVYTPVPYGYAPAQPYGWRRREDHREGDR